MAKRPQPGPQRGPQRGKGEAAPPTQPASDRLDQHLPHEQVAPLGATAQDAEEELHRRQRTDFEGKIVPRRRVRPGTTWFLFLLGLLVIAWGLWILF